MFGLGLSEIIVIAVIGLLVIGPDELPKLARSIGRLINDVKRSTNDFSSEMRNQVSFRDDFDQAPPQKTKEKTKNKPTENPEQLELHEQVSSSDSKNPGDA